MSVAFRRESDEEHKEPRFELPLPSGPNLVTARGLMLTQAKVAELEAALPVAADEDAKALILRNLRYWRTRLATAEIAPVPSGEEAAFGSRVTFRLKGARRVIDIVGDDESEPAAGRIAFSAPLARTLIGAGAGDILDFGGKPDAILVERVEPIPDEG